MNGICQVGRAEPRRFMDRRLLIWIAGVMILLAATSARAIHFPCQFPVAGPSRPLVMRLYGMPGARFDAHFWSWDYVELNLLWQWTLETDDAVELPIPDIATGLCPRGLLPVYRLWNGRTDADHRYTTSVETRQSLIDAGWVPEGYGAEGVAMCALE